MCITIYKSYKMVNYKLAWSHIFHSHVDQRRHHVIACNRNFLPSHRLCHVKRNHATQLWHPVTQIYTLHQQETEMVQSPKFRQHRLLHVTYLLDKCLQLLMPRCQSHSPQYRGAASLMKLCWHYIHVVSQEYTSVHVIVDICYNAVLSSTGSIWCLNVYNQTLLPISSWLTRHKLFRKIGTCKT